MHTKKLKSCTIQFNSDLSGNVIIYAENTKENLEILGEDLIEFVGLFFIAEKIKKLEQLSGYEFLKI